MRPYTRLARHQGNSSLFFALDVSILSTSSGIPIHVHAEGLRGTGKTTIMRSARQILPPITRIRGCLYNCHPDHPHCPIHKHMTPEEIHAIGTERVTMPYLEITHSSKMGTAVGSIDLARLTNPAKPEAALLPGTIPLAHRGIIFVDEINRLAETSPELADVLLGVMGTKPGYVKVEETGLVPVEIPVVASVWAASNPDEEPGPLEDIRRQLSDRFDLVVGMARPSQAEDVVRVLEEFSEEFDAFLPEISERVALFERDRRIGQVRFPEALTRLIAGMYVDFGFESLRAVEAMKLSSKASALLDGRDVVELDDIIRVAPMVLRHRVDPTTLNRVLEHLASKRSSVAAGSTGQKGPGDSQTPACNESTCESRATEDSCSPMDRLVSRIRDRLRDMSGGRAGVSGRTGAGGARGMGAGFRSPGHIQLTAPPKPARPLTDLSLVELIKGEEEPLRV
ncbi:MAG: magnesium chelatase [Bacillota bacterium]